MPSRKEQPPTLCWPGKSNTTCREACGLVLEELFGADGETGEERKDAPSAWDGLLAQGDNRLLLSSLANGPLRRLVEDAGGIRLVYMDPPFAVGADFSAPVAGGTLKALAYKDTWAGGLTSFLDMMHECLLLLRDILAPEGSLYLHCDYRAAAHMRLLLDEVFGPERFLGDIVWHYTGGGRAKRWFSRKHDHILHYARSDSWIFNADAVRVPYKPTSGYARSGIVSRSGKRYLPHPDGTPVDDVWDIPMINPLSAERNGYPTQKPEALLERVILASSRPGDLVADFFCGSGTTAAVAQRLGRRWLAVDKSPLAAHTTRKRLLAPSGADKGGAGDGGARFVTARLDVDSDARPVESPDASPKTRPDRGGEALAQDAEGVSGHKAGNVFSHRARLESGEFSYALSDIQLLPRLSAHTFGLELRGFAVAAEAEGGVGALPEDWRDWLDYWSVGFPCPDLASWPGCRAGALCNRVIWHSARGKKAPAPLRTPDLVWPDAKSYVEQRRVVVTLIDIFANATRFALTL